MPVFTDPYEFQPNTRARASEVNARFEALFEALNVTKLDEDNIQALAIVTSLIADGAVTPEKLSSALVGMPTAPVTVIPASPVDGQIVAFETGQGGRKWILRYDADATGDYDWEFIGGLPMLDYEAGTFSWGGTGYTNGQQPTLDVPLPGEYEVEYGAFIVPPLQVGAWGEVGILREGNLVAATSVIQVNNGPGTYDRAYERTVPLTFVKDDTLNMFHRVASGAVDFTARHMRLHPVRVKKAP